MAVTSTTKTTKTSKSTIGAPSQRSQPSRKGKKAWRKNVDLDEVEEVLEEIRVEERLTGYASYIVSVHLLTYTTSSSALHKKTDEELFQIDVKGDENGGYPQHSHTLLFFNNSSCITSPQASSQVLILTTFFR